jgi:glycosyltransferase involved in cell wall biosynthesis
MKITLVSPYHGGSHRAWAEGYKAHSKHDVTLLSLPGRFWKWRMHGGAVTLARELRRSRPFPDLVLATDMADLTTLLALTRPLLGSIPIALYMHENQLTDPVPVLPGEGPMRRQRGERDLHYAFINYASMLAADAVLFNSTYHRDALFAALPRFLKHFPEFNELETLRPLRGKSQVLPVGIDYSRLEPPPLPNAKSAAPPLVIWNQRWEYDKNPTAFFRALFALHDEGIPFRVALCGQRFRRRPTEFETAVERLGTRIIHVGYAKPARYRRLLWEATITISTAYHEFFGISVLEAIYCHTLPILPHRLSYPELIPARYHDQCLYENEAGLLERVRRALLHPEESALTATALAATAARYAWHKVAPVYDGFFLTLARRKKEDGR